MKNIQTGFLVILLAVTAVAVGLLFFFSAVFFLIVALALLGVTGILLWQRDQFLPAPEVPPETVAPPREAPPVVVTFEREFNQLKAEVELERSRLALVGALTPIFKKLSQVVIGKTEQAALALTTEIFGLTDTSRRVNDEIARSLAEITMGDHSLSATSIKLLEKYSDMEKVASLVNSLKVNYTADLKILRDTVASIREFADQISEMSDLTSVLAINASIEAARVGQAGRGFSVIADNVQKLAKNSKLIADRMAELVQTVFTKVNESFVAQEAHLGQASGMLQKAEGDIRMLITDIAPQIERVSQSISETQRLSWDIKDNLEKITVNLQFQDSTRQILEHVQTGLEAAQTETAVTDGTGRSYHQQAEEFMARYFSVNEEWSTVSIDPQSIKGMTAKGHHGQLKGDVELF